MQNWDNSQKFAADANFVVRMGFTAFFAPGESHADMWHLL